MSLRNAFKNFRRHCGNKETSASATASTREPPSKRLKLYATDEPDIGDDEYDAAVEELLEEYKLKKNGKKGQGHGRIKELMERTKLKRSMWIRKDQPLISEVIQNLYLQIF